MQFSSSIPVVCVVLISLNLLQSPVSGHIHLEMPENIRKIAFLLHEHCVEVTGIDEDWTLQMVRGKMPEDRSIGCYLHCMFDTIGLVSDEGHIRFQEVLHLLPQRHQEILSDVVQRCGTIRE